jgi:hypothetical protein
MFVLGIRCDPAVVDHIHPAADADYYVDYGILTFPRFMRPSSLSSHGRSPSTTFWDAAAKIITNRFHTVSLELPWVSEAEHHIINTIQQSDSNACISWYYIPNPESNPVSEVC